MVNSENKTSLRDRHKQVTQELILSALSEVVAEEGVLNFSVQQVADRAGISHRTIYRHFASRERLLDAFSEWLNKAMAASGGVSTVDSADELPDAAATNFRVWENYTVLIRESAMLYFVTDFRPTARENLTEHLRILISAAAPNLPSEEIERGFALIRGMASSLNWTYLHEQFGFSGAESAEAVRWGISTLLNDMKQRSEQLAESKQEDPE